MGIALSQFAGCESGRNARALGMVLNQMHYAVQAAVNSAAVIILCAEIGPGRNLLILSHMYCVLHQLLDTLALCGRYRHHRNAQNTLHLIYADRSAITRQLVHHIESQHHRHAQLHELNRQIQVALNVRSVHDIDDAVRLLLNDKLARNRLLLSVRRQRINARQIRHKRIRVTLYLTVLSVHRHAREITHMLIGPRKLIKQGSLAAVLLSGQRKPEHRTLRQSILMRRIMVLTCLTQTRMRVMLMQSQIVPKISTIGVRPHWYHF